MSNREIRRLCVLASLGTIVAFVVNHLSDSTLTEKAGEPSKAAMEAARKWLGAQPGSKHLLYDGIYDSLASLLDSFAVKARLVGSTQTLEAFEDEYCKHDEPMRGVVLGVKAMNAVRAALEKAGQ